MKKLHWTQTKAGRKRMSAIQRERFSNHDLQPAPVDTRPVLKNELLPNLIEGLRREILDLERQIEKKKTVLEYLESKNNAQLDI